MTTAEGSRGHGNPFDHLAQQYDEWFDSANGKTIFRLETACLQELMEQERGLWLEVGVGTGRFAEALEVTRGLDTSPTMLRIAAQRGIETTSGRAEALPYPDAGFDGVLMVVTLCFVNDPALALIECSRVLKDNACLVVGIVPANSPWGQFYTRKAREGHPVYSAARFYTSAQVIRMANRAELDFEGANSCLLTPPEETISPLKKAGIVEHAGFVALRFRKLPTQRSESHE